MAPPAPQPRSNELASRHAIDLPISGAEIERLRLLARHLAQDDHAADDVVQETLLAAMHGSAVPVRDAPAWLRGVVRRLSSNRRRRDAIRAQREAHAAERYAPPTQPDIDQPVLATECARDLERAIDALEPAQAEVVRLTYFDELDSSEISRKLDISPNTVRTRLHRARAAMRQRLAPTYGPGLAGLVAPFSLTREFGTATATTGVTATTVKIVAAAAVAAAISLPLFDAGTGHSAPRTPAGASARVATEERSREEPWVGIRSAVDDTLARAELPATTTRMKVDNVGPVQTASDAPRRTPFRSDPRARLARFEAEVRPPFVAYHDLPPTVRPQVSRYGVFLERATGAFVTVHFLDAHDREVQIDRVDRIAAEQIAFEYEDQVLAIESSLLRAIEEQRYFARTRIAVGETQDSNGAVTLVTVDPETQAAVAGHRERIEQLRSKIGAPRVVLGQVAPAH
ncbi:MAG: RNA polymerase sigma factor [Planctomycetota bacterium]